MDRPLSSDVLIGKSLLLHAFRSFLVLLTFALGKL